MKNKIFLFEIFVWLSAVEASTALIYLLIIPTDSKNVWLMGLSRSRLFLILYILFVLVILVWLGISIWRKPFLSEQIQNKLGELVEKRGVLWILIVLLVLIIASGCFFLIQWNIFSSNQQILAYLQRLTPVILLNMIFCAQGLVIVWHFFIKNERDRFIYTILILSGFIFIQWMLVVEFVLSDLLFPEYFFAEQYSDLINNFIPVILFQTALIIQVPYLLRHRYNFKFNFAGIAVIVAIVLAYFFYNAANTHAQEINNDLNRSDQDVYIEFTKKVSETNFSYSGVRNQTPGYPYLQALFCHSELNDQELFSCGKRVNVFLSIVLLFILYFVFTKYLPSYSSFTLILIIASSLYIFKAGYMTVELTFYFFTFLSFLSMSMMLIRPSIKLGTVTGVILGITYLLKATVLPGIALFVFIFLSQQGIALFKGKIDFSIFKMNLSSLFVSIFCFILLIFPYIHQSKVIYGQYFYNVNSTFYIWYDSWDEAKQAEYDYTFTKSWPDIPESQLPSPYKYFQDHTISQILSRLYHGFRNQITLAINQYNSINYLLIYLIFASVLISFTGKQTLQLTTKFTPLIVFFTLYIVGYLFLFAWYFPIAGGPRFFAGLFIPIMFSIFIILNTLKNGSFISFAKRRININWIIDISNILIVALLISDFYIIITKLLPNGYFGS